MNQAEFDRARERAARFRHSSFAYIEHRDVERFALLADRADLFALHGENAEHGLHQICWAADGPEPLIRAAAGLGVPTLAAFVPPGWTESLTQAGFAEYAVYMDYWKRGLGDIPPCADAVLLAPGEYAAASDVTMACRLQSRGFHGETPEWIARWVGGMESAGVDSRDHAGLVRREGGELIAVAFVAIYGHGSPDGAVLWLREIAVHPAHQGRGVGRALLSQALRYGRERGAARAFLLADRLNDRGDRLYRSLGFVPKTEDCQIDMLYEAKEKSH